MKIKPFLFSTLLLFGAPQVYAECAKGSQTVFSCQTEKGKIIEVCDAKKTIQYSFGKPQEKPELALQVPRDKASTTQWEGVGRWMSYSVEIPNGNTVYSVFWGVDRLSESHDIDAGVNVAVNQKQIATVKCAPKKKIIQNLEGIELRKTEN